MARRRGRRSMVARLLAAFAVSAPTLALAAHPARAQGVREAYDLRQRVSRELTLQEAVAVATEENPNVRTARFRFDATRAGLLEAYGNFLPRLDLFALLQKSGAGQFVVNGVVFPNPPTFTTFYQFQVSHRLFDAGRDLFRLGGAHAARRAAEAQVQADRLRIASEIKRQYVAALAAQALKAQASREIEARGLRLTLAQARYELGAVTRSDVLQARIAEAQAEVDRATGEREAQTAELELLRVMGVEADPDSVVLVDRFEVFEPVWDPDSLVARALRDHPRLVQVRAEVEERERDHWIAKTAYLPTLQAAASFEQTASDSSRFLFNDFEGRTTYSLTLNWQLFGGFQPYNETSQAKAELRAAQEALRLTELETAAGVRQAYLALLTAHDTQRTRQESVQLAQKDLNLAQERYRIGALSFPDLQGAQVTFTSSETAYIRATYDFFTALANLEEASAQELFPPGRRAPGEEPGAPEQITGVELDPAKVTSTGSGQSAPGAGARSNEVQRIEAGEVGTAKPVTRAGSRGAWPAVGTETDRPRPLPRPATGGTPERP